MKINILVEGPDNNTHKPVMEYYWELSHIIRSTWSAGEPYIKEVADQHLEVYSTEPSMNDGVGIWHHGKSTFYKQVVSIWRGLGHCNGDFIIKVRADEKFTNLEPILAFMRKYPDKIVCGDVHYQASDFHIGDHIVAGSANIIKKAYGQIYEEYSGEKELNTELRQEGRFLEKRRDGSSKLTTPESILGKSLLEAVGLPITVEAFSSLIIPIGVEHLGDYQVVHTHGGKVWNRENPFPAPDISASPIYWDGAQWLER